MNNNKYIKELEEKLIGGFKEEVYFYYKGKEYNISEYSDLYEKIKEICKSYFDKNSSSK
jgi:hypothetical protein